MPTTENEKKKYIEKEVEASIQIETMQQRADRLAADAKRLRDEIERKEAEKKRDSLPPSQKSR